MSRIRITRPFKYAYSGFRVVTHVVGAELNGDDEAAKVALAEKWGERIPDTGKGKSAGKGAKKKD